MTLFSAAKSPMMEQWHACKQTAKGALLLFRLGDFYEAFYEDAHILAKTLDLTLTQRQSIPMSGIPAHTLESYIEKLLAKGFLVAIADQLEDAKQTKGIVKRGITRIVSPATHIQSSTQKEKANNFFASLHHVNTTFGLCFLDVSTAELFVLELETLKEALDAFARRTPSEILLSDKFYQSHKEAIDALSRSFRFRINVKESWYFDHKHAYDVLTKHFHIHSLDGLGLKGMVSSINAAGALFSYLTDDLAQNLSHVKSLKKESLSEYLLIDFTTQKHLDLLESSSSALSPSLLSVIDKTFTPMGGRLLMHFLSHPLLSPTEIAKRSQGVEELMKHLVHIPSLLRDIRDLERLVMRVKTEHASPRDLLSLALSLEPLSALSKQIAHLQSPIFTEMKAIHEDLSGLVHLIKNALEDPAPIRIHEGGIFKWGFHPDLDALKRLKEDNHSWLSRYQTELRETLDIKTLKVNYTKAFGYYIEVSRGQVTKMPSSFERRQTLVNAERYTTPELKEYEYAILHAEDKIVALEMDYFLSMRTEVAEYADLILKVASEVALIDCILSLSLTAKEYGYTKPIVHSGDSLVIREGKHPILRALIDQKSFIPNDTYLNQEDRSLLLITGPNMAGKSTYIRQVALIVILAQIGSFVPAKEAEIGIVDKVFSRIGASDDLSRGQSTFMVEMTETANILHNATSKSLVILDEIGRGTSTYDGIAIASSVAEYLLETVRAKTLFATHFAELTLLEKEFIRAKNVRVAVQENEDGIVFLHKILEGGADKSYGIHVAKLAGLPDAVIQRAKHLLTDLEEKKPQKKKGDKTAQLLLFSDFSHQEKDLKEEIQKIDVNRLTPLDALALISKWKDEIRS